MRLQSPNPTHLCEASSAAARQAHSHLTSATVPRVYKLRVYKLRVYKLRVYNLPAASGQRPAASGHDVRPALGRGAHAGSLDIGGPATA